MTVANEPRNVRFSAVTDDAARLLAEAEEQIEAWLCELDATWIRILDDARAEALRVVATARAEALEIIAEARTDAAALVAEAQREVLKARTLAAESDATAAALAHAASAAATGRVQVSDMAALGAAVTRLRVELSRVVDAAFDALPAVEATAAALRLDEPESPSLPAPRTKVGFIRRLLRI